MRRTAPAIASLLAALALLFLCGASPALAYRQLLTESLLKPTPPPDEYLPEGPCGLAVTEDGLYVSAYYDGAVDLYKGGGLFSQIGVGSDPEGPCGLAADADGALYTARWHQSVSRISPSNLLIDSGHVTGLAVDRDTGYVYVDHHTPSGSFVSVYDSSGASVEVAGQPLIIGLGTLEEGFGLAAADGRVYVADATTRSVQVYEPSIDPVQPAFSIDGFNSLLEAALAIDPTNGHLLVVDNVQPMYEHPASVVLEFEADGASLGPLEGRPVNGEPSGITVDPESGTLYVTDGNTEDGNVFAYGPYEAPAPPGVAAPLSAQSTGSVPTASSAITQPSTTLHQSQVRVQKKRAAHKRRLRLHRRRHHPRRGGRR